MKMHTRLGSNLLAKKEIVKVIVVLFVVLIQSARLKRISLVNIPHIICGILTIPAAYWVIKVSRRHKTRLYLLPFLVMSLPLICSSILTIFDDIEALTQGVFCADFFGCISVMHIFGAVIGICLDIWAVIVIIMFYLYLKTCDVSVDYTKSETIFTA